MVGELQGSLNREAGGEIADNLSNLYDYMAGRLLVANIQSDESILDEISGLMIELKMG
jgi:flagellar secretion chaperone FliS